MNIKSKIKYIIKKIENKFKSKEPIKIPVLKDNLLCGRVALVTGGSSGIGFSIAKSFLINGCSVIITGRNKEKLEKAAKELKKYADNGFLEVFALDINDIDFIQKNFNEIGEKYSIDILVNNAGIMDGSAIGTTSKNDFEKTMRTNLEGTYFLTQAFIEYMLKNKRKGNILNVSSSSSVRPAVTPYMITKWGINGFTLGLAKKYIKNGIVVNGIAPGPTVTPMLKKDETDITNSSSPSGRYVMPEEVANIATILVSDMGKMIVGDTIYITGGAGIITFDDMSY